MPRTLLLVWVFLLYCCSYSNAEDYQQQYQIGDTGPNGGTVTDVVITSTLTDSTSQIIGDFLEQTDTYVYTETITESVEQITYETVEVTTSVTTENLLTSSIIDSGTMTNTHDCTNSTNCFGMNGADITTGNQQQGGGSAIVNFDLSEYDNMQEVEYGGTVYSHQSNTSVPVCNATSSQDCRDDFKITLTLKENGVVKDVFTHNYNAINWAGSRDYTFSQDVSNITFTNAELEFYGIDRGFSEGYYGPGFSDAFFLVTWNKIDEVINQVLDYVTMETIKNTTMYEYKSDYIPPPIEVFEPVDVIEFDSIEIEFEVSPEEIMTFEIEVVEVDVGIVEVQMTTEYGGDLQIETIETIEIVEMPTDIDIDVGEINVEVAQVEIQESSEDVGVGVGGDTDTTESQSSEPELQPEPEPEREVESTTEPEPESEPNRQDDRGDSNEDPDDSKKEEVKEETKEEKVRVTVAKAKQKVANKILARIISQNDTIVLDNTKLALMVALSDTQGFATYQQKQLNDAMFYMSRDIYDVELNDNPAGNLYLYGSDRMMDKMIDQQYGD